MSELKVYLSGEIHTNWRDQIMSIAKSKNLNVTFTSPVTNHENSDDCGVSILGNEDKSFWHDHKGAKINAIRTRNHIKNADIVVVRFGEKYKQWNAAFDAGYAVGLNKPLIVMHNEEHSHALKEVDGASLAVTSDPEQVVRIIDYVINGTLD
ncbi:MAG: YtoQ family protein [Hyphomicrobiales bacterium]|nr:YtoQ family protein [Hyphomicrobiales bacterium]